MMDVNRDFQNGLVEGVSLNVTKRQIMDRLNIRPDFNLMVIAFVTGIGLYFSLPTEPSLQVLAVILMGLFVVWLGASSREIYGVGGLWLLLLITAGLGRAAWHTAASDSPRLSNAERTYRIEGWVSAIEKSGSSERYVIEMISARGLTVEETPNRMRIRVTKPADPPINAGDTINWLVAAKAPPGPVVPSGYDPARAAYYKGIGGFGFGYGAPESQVEARLGFWEAGHRNLVRWRYGIADQIMAKAPTQTAGLQAALMTGVRRFIPAEHTENLRVAGLAHILAISGLHMALLAGGTYTVMTFGLACILPLSRRYDVRKFAAITAIGAASFYLILSGASVATQRAWVMSVIFFLAIVLDRRAVSMRSVCVAALVTLFLHPESLISVGFQMSFAAVAALVAVYQTWQALRPAYRRHGPFRRVADFFASLSVTSLVAGFATGGFALFHFNRFARYGFAGNLLAMPIFSLFVMPLAVVSLLLMPLGWETGPLYLMGKSLDPILAAAKWVQSWTGAMIYIGAAADWVLPVYGLGFAALCMGRSWIRALGLTMMIVAILGWRSTPRRSTPRPDLRISEAGQVAFWQTPVSAEDKPILFVGSKRSDRYGREQFAQRSGLTGADWAPYEDRIAQCDVLACRARIGDWQISILQSPSEVPEECEASDLVILSVRRAGPVARRNCSAVLVDEVTLRETSAMDVYLGDYLITKAARPVKNRRRPWH